MIYGGYFDVSDKLNNIERLEKEVNNPNFWDDNNLALKKIEELNNLKESTDDIINLKKDISDNLELLGLASSSDIDILNSIFAFSSSLDERIDKLELEVLLNGEYDHNNAIVEIHSGAGGVEACDWALMLYRMYTRWCERKNYKIEVLDYQEGEEAGIKRVSFLACGLNAYGYLKCEQGVHRLVRLSPFDSNNKRHTSFASVLVIPELDDSIDVVIKDEDLKIDVYRSSGAGGQSVNTTDSAVRITHLPTKIVVTCQNERSQIKNKEKALSILKGRLKLLEIEEQEKKLNNLKGDIKNIDFGSQIRSYVMHPYSMVKDHRTLAQTSDVSGVLDGDIDLFIEKYLRS